MSLARRRAPRWPRAAERGMAAAGIRYVRAVRKLTEQRLREALRAARGDVDEPSQVFRLSLAAMIGMVSVRETEIPPGVVVTAGMLGRYGTMVQRHAENTTRRYLRMPILTAVDPARGRPDLTREWATEAASRIRIIEETYRDRVRALIQQGYQEGWGLERIAREIERTGAATENRARLWARDQVATINAQATEDAHHRAGVTHYTWITAGDERVREEQEPGWNHVERDGLIYAWDNPPRQNQYDGHPGEGINCRCVAVPVMPEELDELLAAQAARGDLPPYAAT